MLFFPIYAILLLILSAIGLVHYFCVRAGHPRKNEVRLPPLFQLIGVICTVFFDGILIWAILDDEATLWVLGGFAVFSLLGVLLIFGPMRSIRYDKEGFVLRTFPFYLPRRYEYSQITAIREDANYLYLGNRWVYLEDEAVGYFEFLDQIEKAYKKNHKKSIPRKKKRVNADPFNGNVESPGTFIFAYVLIYALLAGFLLFIFFQSRLPAEEDMPQKEVIFSRCEIEDDSVEFYIEGDELPYRISYRNAIPTTDEEFAALADEGQTVQIRYLEKKKAYNLYSVTSADGTNYLSYEICALEERLAWYSVLGMVGIFALIWTWYVVRSIQIGRNPQKYSRKTILRYFRPGYVRMDGSSVE